MEYFNRINKFLEQGMKLTNSQCEQCKKMILFDSSTETLFCAHCNQNFDP